MTGPLRGLLPDAGTSIHYDFEDVTSFQAVADEAQGLISACVQHRELGWNTIGT